jgi:hypothetical protein
MAINDHNAEMSAGGEPKGGPKFDRGHPLSIFVKDRNEDMSALLFAFLIAMSGIMFFK